MNIDKLFEAELSIIDIINAIKDVNEYQVNENTTNWIAQYDGVHKILKKQGKSTINGEVELQKTVINYQKLITDLSVAFLFGNPIDLILKNPNESNSILFSEFKQIWERSKTDATLYNFAKDVLIQSRASIEVLKDADKVNHTVINALNSIDFFINFNDEGKTDAFERTFKVTDYDIAAKKVKERVYNDLLTNDLRIVTDITDDKNPFEIKREEINGKMPIIYAQIKEAEFQSVQNLIDRLEKVISKNADSNDYFADPRLVVNGEVVTNELKKDTTGDILEIKGTSGGGNAEISYLVWDRASESYKLEVEFLIDNIFAISSTPKIDFNNLKSIGNISGVALELMFLATTIKTKAHIQTTFNEVVTRLISVMKNQLSNMPTIGKNFNELEIDFTFNDGIPVNLKETIETLVFGVNGGVMSKETALENNPLVDNSTKEAEQIQTENSIQFQ